MYQMYSQRFKFVQPAWKFVNEAEKITILCHLFTEVRIVRIRLSTPVQRLQFCSLSFLMLSTFRARTSVRMYSFKHTDPKLIRCISIGTWTTITPAVECKCQCLYCFACVLCNVSTRIMFDIKCVFFFKQFYV